MAKLIDDIVTPVVLRNKDGMFRGQVGWHLVPPYEYAVLYVLSNDGVPLYESPPLEPAPGETQLKPGEQCKALATRLQEAIDADEKDYLDPTKLAVVRLNHFSTLIAQLRLEKDPSLAKVIEARRAARA